MGRKEKLRNVIDVGRSFKEVVESLPHHPKANDRLEEYHKNRAVSGEENNERKLEKMA